MLPKCNMRISKHSFGAMTSAGFIQGCSFPLLGFLLVLLLVYLLLPNRKHNNEPPGPRQLPILGNLQLLDFREPCNTFIKLSKKYGSVFTFHLGPKKLVVLVGYEAVKEALVDHAEEFGERDIFTTSTEDRQDYGIVFSNGESWRQMRRFALSALKDFGMGRKAIEEKIIEECKHLVNLFKSYRGDPFDTNAVMNAAVSNVVCSMVCGKRLDYNDPVSKGIVYRMSRGMQLLGTRSVQLYQLFPSIGKWISKTRAELGSVTRANHELYLKMITELKETLDPHHSRCIIDTFLIKQQQLEDAGVRNSQFHSQNLVMTVGNMFAAGTETTATTLRWTLLYMAKYPDVQDLVREEISRVIGARQVQSEDRKNLPFTNAVVHETQRHANVVPLNVPHKTSCDVTFKGHCIKKGTTVYPILASVLYDETQWTKPNSFYPGHFLDKDGKFMNKDAFMPFSAGRRACAGEALARMELFIFFATLIQHFRFTAPPGVREEELELTSQIGAIRCPVHHKLCAVPIFLT